MASAGGPRIAEIFDRIGWESIIDLEERYG
jgi:hypothetical protein